jgi:hypothetical protein
MGIGAKFRSAGRKVNAGVHEFVRYFRSSPRNRILLWLGVSFLILSILSLPAYSLNLGFVSVPITFELLTPTISQQIPINITNAVIYLENNTVLTIPLNATNAGNLTQYLAEMNITTNKIVFYHFYAVEELRSKNGISVDSPINISMSITVPDNYTQNVENFTIIRFRPLAAQAYPNTINKTYYVPGAVYVILKPYALYPNTITWAGWAWGTYFLSGNFGARLYSFPTSNSISKQVIVGNTPNDTSIAGSDVTSSSYNNTIVTCLTVALIGFGLLTLRKEK